MGDPVLELPTETVRGLFTQLRTDIAKGQEQNHDLEKILKQYVNQYRIPSNLKKTLPETDESNNTKIEFGSIEQANKFANAYPDKKVFEVSGKEPPHILLLNEQFDLNLRASQMIRLTATALLNPDIRRKMNLTQSGQSTAETQLDEAEKKIISRANGSVVQFLYDQFVRNTQSAPDGLKRASQWYNNDLRPMLNTFQEDQNKIQNRILEQHFQINFDIPILTELEAMTTIHERMKRDPTIEKFQLQVPKGTEDVEESTDLFALVTYKDRTVEEIRYQIKHHTVHRDQQTAPFIKLKGKAFDNIDPTVLRPLEILADPQKEGKLTVYDLRTMQSDHIFPNGIRDFRETYLQPAGFVNQYDFISRAAVRDAREKRYHFGSNQNVTRRRVGWVIVTTEMEGGKNEH